MSEPTQARRDEMVLKIASLWRGDWTGTNFDGRTGQSWLRAAVTGSAADLDELERELIDVEESYL
jgi:hypothetical protein